MPREFAVPLAPLTGLKKGFRRFQTLGRAKTKQEVVDLKPCLLRL